MTITCPHCGQSLEVEAEFFGQKAECPQCNGKFIVPNHRIAVSNSALPLVQSTTRSSLSGADERGDDVIEQLVNVGLIPNFRKKDNFFQGIVVLGFAVIGIIVGLLVSGFAYDADSNSVYICVLLGLVGGLIAGLLVSGLWLHIKNLQKLKSVIPNYLLASVVVTLFCCMPCGIPAIVYASQVNAKIKYGDIKGAVVASKKAKMWVWISVVLGLLAGLCWLLQSFLTASSGPQAAGG